MRQGDLFGQGVRVTWVNHSSVLVQMAGFTFLTDPIWSERCVVCYVVVLNHSNSVLCMWCVGAYTRHGPLVRARGVWVAGCSIPLPS